MMPTLSIEELPDPIIEYILSYLSPYRDLKQCMQVNKAWYRYVYNVVRKTQMDLFNAVCHMSVQWCHLEIMIPSYTWHMPVQWHGDLDKPGDTITKRYSHSACCSANSMYIFGGCTTANTIFNDLWCLDLETRYCSQACATGTYPPPKACATLVCHCDNLVLFGGWTHTGTFPLHQRVCKVFNQIHVYNTVTKKWTQITSATTCPPRARHSATVHGDFMVVFGGTRKQACDGPFQSSNDVWTLDLKSYQWQKQTIVTASPPPRYGHSQIIIDKNNLLVMGGCDGPNMSYTDIWLLKMVDGPGGMWEWEKMNVLSKENGAPQLAFHPACKVGSQVVVMSKTQKSRTSPSSLPRLLRSSSRIWVPPQPNAGNRIISVRNAKRPASEVEHCVNGRRGVLKRPVDRQNNLEANHMSSSNEESLNASKEAHFSVALNSFPLPSQNSALQQITSHNSLPSTSGYDQNTAGNSNSATNVAMSNSNLENQWNLDNAGPSQRNSSWEVQALLEQKGLDQIKQMLNKLIAGDMDFPAVISSITYQKRSSHVVAAEHPMCLYVLDISTAVQGTVTWRTLKNQSPSAPEEMILYSLVLGKGEVIMFGGIQKDLNSRQLEGETIPEVISNSLHFMTAERFVI